MTPSHPYYLASEGFIVIFAQRSEEMIGLRVMQRKEVTDIIQPLMENEELYLTNKRTGEKILVSFLFERGLIEEKE